jgi:uncharacterized protein YidB (DUF937 family)
MSRGPLTALLAVLAVAGYQNRDKIAEMLRGLQNGQGTNPDGTASGNQGGLVDLLGRLCGGGIGSLLGGSSSGSILSGGLGGLIEQFRQNGLGDRADSWVSTGPNQEVDDRELSQALGDDTLAELTEKTGLSREEILARLARDLPKAVDDLTPNGTVPTEEQFGGFGSVNHHRPPCRTPVAVFSSSPIRRMRVAATTAYGRPGNFVCHAWNAAGVRTKHAGTSERPIDEGEPERAARGNRSCLRRDR